MNKNNQETFDKNDGNLEVIEPVNSNLEISSLDQEQAVKITPEGVNVKKGGNFVIGSLNLISDSLKKRHERHYQENFWHLVADVILVLIIIGLIIFSFISFSNKDDKIALKINVDDQNVVAGQLKTFELEYRTNEDVKDGKIKVEFPRNFILESATPLNYYDGEKNTFYLENLPSGSTGKIKIEGYVIGNKGDHQMISFNFACDKCGKEGISSSYFYNISKYFNDFSINFPDKIYNGSEVEAKLFIKNNASRELKNLEIELSDSIELKKSDLKIENNKLFLEKIEPRQSLEYSVFLTSKANNVEIKPKISFDFLNNKFHQNENNLSFNVSDPEIKIEINSNKNIAENGEKINYKIKYNNQSSESIKNINIRLNSGQIGLFLSSVEGISVPKNTRIEKNTIIIEDLISQEEGEIDLEVSFERRQVLANQEILLVADVEYQINNQNVRYISYSPKTKIVSEVLGSVLARYYSPQGDQLGVGPLPPAVDLATNYWVFLEFNNSGNKLKNFVLTAELPDNVYFSENKRVLDGKLTYAEIGKRLIWEINEIDAGINKYRANFEITLIPGKEDLGKVLDLVRDIKFTAYDDFTGQEIFQNLNNINTNLDGDLLSTGKGKVVIFK
ncbi:MAG TPA: hypothetical protein PK686_00990 [bacterium]|nr:hypothetical protein [bacterium]HPV65246.1 hypothetical protein [bacterium]